ncbi:MAG: PhzF family phenazine biosynthesis protein [Verrucomicrobiota bacterium]|nr:PhzF family phenazine biosynthesis protein [Verrucomicrobiota bacterium]
MKLPYFEIAAFSARPFAGNPAGVCVLQEWLPDALLQAIGTENNLAETAFIVARDGFYELRWFTPTVEVDLCGHATLASAHVIFEHLSPSAASVRFHSPRSGELGVAREGDRLVLDFPSRPPVPCETTTQLVDALGRAPAGLYEARDYMAVFAEESDVANLTPDFAKLAQLPNQGVIVTAPGSDCDFVSRFFAPRLGIDEDPVTGSTHCYLIPYWSERLGKSTLFARQLSRRGGEVFCEDAGERVRIGGHAVTYLTGEIEVPDTI